MLDKKFKSERNIGKGWKSYIDEGGQEDVINGMFVGKGQISLLEKTDPMTRVWTQYAVQVCTKIGSPPTANSNPKEIKLNFFLRLISLFLAAVWNLEITECCCSLVFKSLPSSSFPESWFLSCSLYYSI